MSGAHVFIDRSQFPENVRRDLLGSFRSRAINHKFHYESYKQAAKWLALHEAYSPARNDASCRPMYDNAFAATAEASRAPRAHVVGLGCGGGQKEAQLLARWRVAHLSYTASDVSLPLVLTAREAARDFVPKENSHAIVCDLATTTELGNSLDQINAADRRVVTLFGIIPNFEPAPLLSRVAALLRPDDLLLLGANLSPGDDYAAGVQRVLPQYDNDLTRDWLLTLLLDSGFDRTDGELRFAIESDERKLRRIAASFELKHQRDIRLFGETISFAEGERIRVFFSYRHTPQTVRSLLLEHQIEIMGEWRNGSGEEGVFLCRKCS